MLAVLARDRRVAFGAWYGNARSGSSAPTTAAASPSTAALPYELPFGIKLYGERYASPIQTDSLPPQAASDAVTGHDLRSREDAVSLIEEIQKSQGVAVSVRARNRELIALVPVALLLTAGFAAVFAQENARLGNLSLIYGAYFLAVCLATHIYLRIRLPNADPYLFPLVALLTAFGLVMIYRIDESLARDQANWFVLGLVLFALTIQFLRDYEVLERYRYTIAARRAAAAAGAAAAGDRPAGQRRLPRGQDRPARLPAGRVLEDRIVVFLASYLREHREVLIVGARRVLGVTLPPLKHFGPMLVVWGASMFMLVFIRDLGSSLMFFAAFLALLYVATGALLLRRHRDGDVPRRRLVLRRHRAPRPRPGRDLAQPLPATRQATGTRSSQSIFAQADGGLFGKGFGQALITIPGTHNPDCACCRRRRPTRSTR